MSALRADSNDRRTHPSVGAGRVLGVGGSIVGRHVGVFEVTCNFSVRSTDFGCVR